MKIKTKREVIKAMSEKKLDERPSVSTLNDLDIEKAINFMRDNADNLAEASAKRKYMEEYRKSLKSLLMKKFIESPISAQEREAYAHQDYQDHIKALQTAIYQHERLLFLWKSAEIKISAWQTKSSNHRSLGI
jgi:Mg2+ and Co2+ transporter CorA